MQENMNLSTVLKDLQAKAAVLATLDKVAPLTRVRLARTPAIPFERFQRFLKAVRRAR